MGKDRKGVPRGACSHASCECDDYELPSEGHPCAYCGHYPAEHKSAGATRQASPPAASEVRSTRSPSPSTTSSSSSSVASDPFFTFASPKQSPSSSSTSASAGPSSSPAPTFSSYSASTTSFARPTTGPIPTASSTTSSSHHHHQQHQQQPGQAPPPAASRGGGGGHQHWPEHHTAEVQTAFSASTKRGKPKESLPMQLWNNPQEVVKDVKIKVKQKTKKHQA